MTSYSPPPHGFRTFLIVWATQSISVIGSALTFFAINIWLTQTLYPRPEQKPTLAFALSLVALSFALPTIFGAPLAGAWADRHDRRWTMLVCDFASGVLCLLLVALVVFQVLQLWSLIVMMVLFASLGTFHSAAFDTSYAMLVSPEQLPRANGMMQTIWSFSGIVSPVLAATIIVLPTLARTGDLPQWLSPALAWFQDGAALAMLIDAISFFVVAAVLLLVQIPSPTRTDLLVDGKRRSIWSDVGLGASYIWQRRPMLWLLGTFTVVNFVSSGRAVYQPLIVKFNLAEDWAARGFSFESALALLGSVSGVGGLLGGLLISTWGGLKRRRIYGVLVPMVIFGAAQTIYGLSHWLYLSSAMAALAMVMIPLMNAHSQSIWQAQTPRELQGRVFAVRRVIAQCTTPLSTVLAGLFGGLFDPGLVMAVFGAIMLIFCTAQLFNSHLMRVEDKVWLDELAARSITERA